MANVVNLPTYEQAVAILEDLGIINTNVDSVNVNVDAVKNDVTTINTNTNTINTRTNSMNTVLNAVNSNTARGSVKSVQRGNFDSSVETSVAISTINSNKSILLVNSRRYDVESVAYIESATRIRLKGNLNWQVIEFY